MLAGVAVCLPAGCRVRHGAAGAGEAKATSLESPNAATAGAARILGCEKEQGHEPEFRWRSIFTCAFAGPRSFLSEWKMQ